MQRRPNASAALTDFLFAGLAFAGGWVGVSLLYAALTFVAAAVAWWWSRRGALAAMSSERRISQGAIALAMIAGVLGVAYWIGLMLGGHN